ncbi:MAG: restriction endonuclease subunit S [Nostoc sp.]|uniref:restriction endonuclease subunit S n=1 Tax=Nostoc sp. TaxID=1180 RepID=UPI002FF444F6
MDEIQVPLHWNKIKLGEIVKFKSGNSKPKDTVYQPSEEKKIPVYGGNGILGYTNSLFSNQRLLVIGRVGAYCGCVHIAESPNWITDNALYSEKWVINDIYIDFLAEYLKFFNLNRFQRRGGQPLITQSIIHDLYLYLPPLPEQKTIAHTLRTIQKAKETRQRELELERERKAALMQYLFTHGTRNETREEKEIGEIPESWKLVKLDSLVEFLSGGTPAKNHPEWWQGSIPWVSTKDLKQPRLSDAIDHISKEGLENGSRLVSEKTLLVAVRGMCLAKNIPVAITEVSMAFNQDIKALVPSSQIEAEYLLCAIQYLKDYLLRFVGTSAHGTKRLPTSSLKTLPIPLPKIEEQQLIAKVLKFCDRKIQALEKELTLIDELFHAMLEQLMTGKISTQPLTETYV